MKNKNLTKIFWSFGLAGAIIGIVFAGMMVGGADENGTQSLSKNAGYTSHDPIYINGNSDFTEANGVTGGNGTESGPYIIEGWDINIDSIGEPGVKGIHVENTNVYFIIRNCKIYNGLTHPNEGIYFYNVINEKIENCEIYNTTVGIFFSPFSNNTIINSSISCPEFTDAELPDNSHLIALNTTFDKNRISFGDTISSLTVKWYLHIKVVDSSGSPISNANVRIMDPTNGTFKNYTTNADGWVRWIECTEYWQNQTTGTYYTSHNITVSKTGYVTNYSDPYMNESKEITIVLTTSAEGPVHNLDKDTYYQTIQAGVDDADPGNTIEVSSGIYYENVVITKTLTLMGEDRNTTIIDGGGTGDVVYISANWVNVSGFGVRNGNSSYSCGICIYSSSNNQIINCTAYNNSYGIRPVYSSNNQITNCAVYDNIRNGIDLSSSSNNNLTNCAVYNNSEHGIDLYSSSNNNITNCNVYSNINYGIWLWDSSNNNQITNCDVYNNSDGIWLSGSSNNQITNCTAYNNTYRGIHLSSSSNNQIINCTAYNHTYHGIRLDFSSNNQITNCAFYNNSNGIRLYSSSYNQITNCAVYNNYGSYGGIRLAYSSNNNSIYHNNFINNTVNAYDECTNIWDNGYPSGGNYWSDYDEPSEGAYDNNTDGIVDTPYDISGGSNQDRYPLMSPWNVSLNFPPTANFTYSPVGPTTGDVIQFNDTSTDSDGTIVSWFWDFGDGNTITVQNPTHQYATAGNYSVSLTVTDDDGGSDTKTVWVNVVLSYQGTLSGYVKDNVTSNPIQDVLVNVSLDVGYRNAYTNETGYYYIDNIPICYCLKNVTVSKEGYVTKTEWIGIAEGTWLNFTLDPVSVNQPPIVNITYPEEGQAVNGTVTISGSAYDTDSNLTQPKNRGTTIQKVEVSFDNVTWGLASGTTSWSFDWDTTTVSNGWHTIYARAYDGIDYSEIKSVNVYVDNFVPATVDYIVVTDAPDGSALTTVTLPIGGTVTAYASGYNNTGSTYIGLVECSWGGSGGVWSPATGTSSTFTAGTTSGTYTQTAQNTTLGVSDTFDVQITSATVDYITITDTSGGTAISDQTINVGFNITGWASVYNNTAGYIGIGAVNWSVSNVDGASASTNPTTGPYSTFDSGFYGGTAIWKANYGGIHNDTVVFTIITATIDYIQIRDASGGGGSVVDDMTYYVGETDTYWCAGYNYTTGYIGDLSVDWWSNDTSVGTVTSSGTSTLFEAVGEGTCYVEATYYYMKAMPGITDTTGVLTVVAANQPPTANFTYSPEAPTDLDTIQFTDTSIDLDGMIVEWSWDFGDGTTLTLQNPTHQYADDGTYTVTLTVTDDNGAVNTTSKQITVLNVAPVSNFTYSPSTPTTADLITFNAGAYDLDGYIVSYEWKFGDGGTSTSHNPTHQYTTADDYTVTLIVTDNDGATDTCIYVITVSAVNQPPAAVTLYQPVDISTSSMTLAWSENTDSDFAKYEIYESGSPGILGSLIETITVRAVTTFVRVGLSPDTTYYFTVRVVDTGNLYNDSNQVSGKTLKENQPPTAVTLYDPTEITTSSMMLTWSQNTDDDFAKYEIYQSPSEGVLGTLIYTITEQTTTSYTVTGLSQDTTYYFTVRVYDTAGLFNGSNQVSGKTLKENQLPTAFIDSITPNPAIFGESVTFTGHGTDDDGSIEAYNWYSSIDGTFSTTASFSTSTLSVGTHTIFFKVMDDDGEWSDWDTETLVINLNVPPTVNITYPEDNQTVNGVVTIAGTASDSGGVVQKVEIKIDDGDWQLATGTSSWTFEWNTTLVSDGLYTIYARAFDGFNYSDIRSVQVNVSNIVNRPPVAEFVFYQGIDVADDNEVNVSLRVSGEKYRWVNLTVYADDAEVGFISLERTPGAPETDYRMIAIDSSKIYTIIINYTADKKGGNPVWLDIDYNGIFYEEHMVFHETSIEEFNLTTILDVMIRSAKIVKFDASGSDDPDGSIVNYTWDFGDGCTGYERVMVYTYKNYDTYTVTLSVTDNSGDTGMVSKEVSVSDVTGDYAVCNDQIGVELDCPADLLITDDFGRIIGYNSVNQSFENWVPNASMVLFGDVEIYFIPKDGDYAYRVSGNAEGVYVFSVFDPGEYDPGEYSPGEYTGKVYRIDSAVTNGGMDELVVSNGVVSISSSEDKYYSVYIKYMGEIFSLEDVHITSDITHNYTVVDWSVLSSTDTPSVKLEMFNGSVLEAVQEICSGLFGFDLLKPDLVIVNVTVLDPLKEGEIVSFSVEILNKAKVTPASLAVARDVYVELWVDGEYIGNSSKISLIYSDSTKYAVVQWRVKSGSHTLRFVVCAEDDVNQGNNEYVMNVDVKGEKALIVITPEAAAVIAGAGVGVGLVLFALVGTEIGKYKLFTMLAPLYMKTRKDELLSQYTRGRIHGFIEANPGVHYSLIKRTLDMRNGTLAYHLDILKKSGLIMRKKDGFRERFFPANRKIKEINYLSKSEEAVIDEIRAKPGISQKALASKLRISQPLTSYYTAKMADMGIITSVKDGKEIKYYLKKESDET